MSTLLNETWESGTLGVRPTTGGSAWNSLVGPGFTYDNTHVFPGGSTKSCKMVAASNNQPLRAVVTSSDRGYEEIRIWPLAAPSVAVSLGSLRGGGDTVNLCDLRVGTDMSVSIRNSGFVKIAGSPATTLKTGQWNKIQRYYDNVAGQQRLMVFTTDPTGNSPDYDSGLVSTTKAGRVDLTQIGAINAATWTVWIDDYNLNTDGFLIPTPPPPVGGAVTWRDGVVNPTSSTGGAATVVIPATVATGDLMILQFVGSGGAWTEATPSGWTKIPIDQATPNVIFHAWWKVAGSGDHGTTVTVTSSGGTGSYQRDLMIDVFTGGKLGAAASRMATSSSTAHPAPSVTTVDTNAWILNGCADRRSPSSSSFLPLPSNLTDRTHHYSTSGGATISSITATDDAVGPGTNGSNTITGTVSTTDAVAWTIAIEPTAVTVPFTVSAGPDLSVEPFRPLTITPTASVAVDSWAWQQLSPATPDIVTGATVDADGTLHLAPPADHGLGQFTLRAIGHKAGVTPDPGDNMVLNVWPATRWWVAPDGTLVSLRIFRVT